VAGLPLIRAGFERFAFEKLQQGRDMSKSKALKLLVAALFVIGATVAAFADPVEVRFAGLGGQSQNGEYTYPYYLTIDNGPQMPMICDDFLHQSNVGDTWQANLTNLGIGNLGKTRFNNLTDYEEEGFLLMQINDGNQNEWGNINFAIWKIFDPNVNMGDTPPGTLGAKYWYEIATSADLSNVDFSNVEIVTPKNPSCENGDQEFMYLTPEPGTLMLIGSGLLGLFSQRKRFA
jgi:hypothetical protein